MSQKIILFLSELKENSASRSYHCPDGSQVEGAQTNEAPVQYLLRRYPDTTEILCIVTEKAEGAFASLSEKWGQLAPGVSAVRIPYEEGEEFSGAPLSAILSHVRPGDEILLETTGGFRNAVMYLLLLGRILSYTGVRTVCAVYSNFQTSEIEDISSIVSLFDLVGGMQELTSFGSVRTLRAYYGDDPADPAIGELLSSLEQLNDAILLCRTRQIDGCMESFGKALDGVEHCSDPLMRELVPAFRKKFGNKMNIISLIKWCVESDMLQQALTVYTERVPSLIAERRDLFYELPDLLRVRCKEYEDPAAVWVKNCLLFARRSDDSQIAGPVQALQNLLYRNKDKAYVLSSCLNNPKYQEIRTGLENVQLIIELADLDGNYNARWTSLLPSNKQRLIALMDIMKGKVTTRSFLSGICESKKAKDLICCLLELDPNQTPTPNFYARTLRHLEKLLQFSGRMEGVQFRKEAIEKFQTIARDYLYMKMLRNLANHANDEETSDQTELMEYLCEFGYVRLEEVSSRDVKEALLAAMERF